MITVLDRYTSNYYRLSVPDKLPDFSHGDKLVFSHTDKNKTITSVGIYLGHDVDTDRTGRYQRALIGDEKIEFDEQQTLALSHFPEFKKQFKAKFNGSIPVTARYHIFTKQMYFYFYSEERYVFGDFVRDFQRHVQSAVFFFQIGAREAMRLSPATDHIR
jgi:cell fate regulator YaaT (PSP1 superfamily)